MSSEGPLAKARRSEAEEAKRFGIILAILLAAWGGWLLWRHRSTGAWVAFSVGTLALLISRVLPSAWLRFFRLWMKFAEVLSWVMTRVILSLCFYLVVTPIGLALRAFGKRPLDLRFKDDKPSYWVDKPESEYTLERYRKVF